MLPRILLACLLLGFQRATGVEVEVYEPAPGPFSDEAVDRFRRTTGQRFRLTSSAISAYGSALPLWHTCDGPNISPSLEWKSPPRGTKSYALVMAEMPETAHDKSQRVHWVAWGMQRAQKYLAEEERPPKHGTGDWPGVGGYNGPCPPRDNKFHSYFFQLYALDAHNLTVPEDPAVLASTSSFPPMPLDPMTTLPELRDAMKGHILGDTRLDFKYKREARSDGTYDGVDPLDNPNKGKLPYKRMSQQDRIKVSEIKWNKDLGGSKQSGEAYRVEEPVRAEGELVNVPNMDDPEVDRLIKCSACSAVVQETIAQMQRLEDVKGTDVREHDKVEVFDQICPVHINSWGMKQEGKELVHRFVKVAPGVDVLDGAWVRTILQNVCARVYEALEDDIDIVYSLRQAEQASAEQMICRDKLEQCYTDETLAHAKDEL